MQLLRPFAGFAGVLAAACLTVTPALAGQRGSHGASPTHPTATTHPTTHPTKSVVHHTPIPVAQRIANNPALAARLQALLPAGMTLASAAEGFRNQGQFIAALHVSKNLNIPFAQLKAEMTGADHDSLGRAIHGLQPNVNARSAAKTAEQEARADIKATKPAPPPDHDKDKDDK